MLHSCDTSNTLNGHWTLEFTEDSTEGYFELIVYDSIITVYDDDATIYQHALNSFDYKSMRFNNDHRLEVLESDGTKELYSKLLGVPEPPHLSDSFYLLRRYQFYLNSPYQLTNGQSFSEWFAEYEQFISGETFRYHDSLGIDINY